MKKLLLALLCTPAFAWHCPPTIVDNVTHVCKNFSEPVMSDVSYDSVKKEFRYELKYKEVTSYTRDVFNCWGHFMYREYLKRARPGSVPFIRPDEGNTDFTVIREVRQYLEDHENEKCR